MKKVVSLALVGMMVFSTLTGCGSTGTTEKVTNEQETESNEANAEGASTEAPAEEGKEEQATITMMLQGVSAEDDFETTQLPDLIHAKFPNVTLEVTRLPDDQYYTALKTKLASGECPDIIEVQPRQAGTNAVVGLAEAGYLAPITDLECISAEPDTAKADMSYEGEVYAVSTGMSILGTWYNKSVFEENNLEEPKNWDEFLSCCETLKNAGIQPIVMGDKDMYVMQFGLYQVAANQIYPTNPDYDMQLKTGESKFTDEGTWDKVLGMYQELYEKGYIDSTSLGLSSQQATQKFIDGKAAMIFEGSFNKAAVCASGSATFDRGFMPLAANDAGTDTYACIAGSAGKAIYSGSKNVEICKEILNAWYSDSSPIYDLWVEKASPVISWGKAAANIDEMYKPFIDKYNTGKAYYFCNQGWASGTENEMESKLSELIGKQGTTVTDITESMQLKYEELSSN